MELVFGEDALARRLAALGIAAVEEVERKAGADDVRVVVLILDVPSDRASITIGNYESSAEAVKDAELLAKALRLNV